jgi:hypothetical protein
MLSGTTLVAIATSAVRFAYFGQGSPSMSYWIGWGIAVPSIAGISLISLPPVIFFTLGISRLRIGMWLLFVYAAVATIATIIVAIRLSRPMGLSARVFMEVACLIVAFASTLAVPLLVARSRGRRLKIPFEFERSSTRGQS